MPTNDQVLLKLVQHAFVNMYVLYEFHYLKLDHFLVFTSFYQFVFAIYHY